MVDDTVTLAPDKTGFWTRRSRSLAPALTTERRAEGDTFANVRNATAVMLIGFSLFLLFDSEGLQHVARDLPGNAVSDALVAVADRWHALMQSAGFARIAPALRAVFETLRGIGW